jgi:hypothetical protein
MSINDINNAAAAMNQLKARYEGFLDDADNQIVARQAAYDGLSGNLKGIVSSEMHFHAYIEPDNPDPTNVDGGTFNTIREAVDRAPLCSYVAIYLQSDQEYLIDANIHAKNRRINLFKQGSGERPVVRFTVNSSGSNNSVWCFTMGDGGSFRAGNVDFVIDDKGDVNLPWSNTSSAFSYVNGGHTKVELVTCSVTAPEGTGITSCYTGGQVNLGMWNVTLDGPFAAVKQVSSGVALISSGAMTLLNGAFLNDGGTLGTSLLMN